MRVKVPASKVSLFPYTTTTAKCVCVCIVGFLLPAFSSTFPQPTATSGRILSLAQRGYLPWTEPPARSLVHCVFTATLKTVKLIANLLTFQHSYPKLTNNCPFLKEKTANFLSNYILHFFSFFLNGGLWWDLISIASSQFHQVGKKTIFYFYCIAIGGEATAVPMISRSRGRWTSSRQSKHTHTHTHSWLSSLGPFFLSLDSRLLGGLEGGGLQVNRKKYCGQKKMGERRQDRLPTGPLVCPSTGASYNYHAKASQVKPLTDSIDKNKREKRVIDCRFLLIRCQGLLGVVGRRKQNLNF